MAELLETERTYIEDLRQIIEVCLHIFLFFLVDSFFF